MLFILELFIGTYNGSSCQNKLNQRERIYIFHSVHLEPILSIKGPFVGIGAAGAMKRCESKGERERARERVGG